MTEIASMIEFERQPQKILIEWTLLSIKHLRFILYELVHN